MIFYSVMCCIFFRLKQKERKKKFFWEEICGWVYFCVFTSFLCNFFLHVVVHEIEINLASTIFLLLFSGSHFLRKSHTIELKKKLIS